MANIQKGFIFRTRTFEKDYIVLSGGGVPAGIEEEKFFDETFRAAGINGTEDPAAGLCNFEEKYCVLCAGLQTGNNDKAGRPIRFSFCCVFPKNESDFALATLNNIINKWENAERKLNFFINQELYQANEIKFDHENFIKWLNDELPKQETAPKTEITERKLAKFPAKNHFVKWEKETDKFTYDAPLKNIEKGKNKHPRYFLYCIIAVTLVLGVFPFIKNMFSTKSADYQVAYIYNEANAKIRDILGRLDELSDEVKDEIFRTDTEYKKIKLDYSILQKKDMTEITQDEAGKMSILKSSGDVLGKRLHGLSKDQNLIDAKRAFFLSISKDIDKAYGKRDIELLQKMSEQTASEAEKVLSEINFE